MSGSNENSPIAGGLVIEVIGPLLDDRGLLARTYQDLLAAERVVLRPGAVDQVAGAAVGWALQTLMEGHGRDDLLDDLPALEQRVTREWEGIVRSGLIRPAADAASAWQSIVASDRPILLLFGGAAALVPDLLSGAGLPSASHAATGGSGPAGLPRPDAVREWLTQSGMPPQSVRAAVRSPAAALAAAAAGLGEVCLVGAAENAGEMLPTDVTLADLGAFLERSTMKDEGLTIND